VKGLNRGIGFHQNKFQLNWEDDADSMGKQNIIEVVKERKNTGGAKNPS